MSYNFKKSKYTDNLRLIIFVIIILILFLVLILRLYNLQIINGELLKNQVIGTISKEVALEAPRGNIYDRLGRPLATNNSSFAITIDPSVTLENNELNSVILKTMNLLEKNNEKIIDEFPISKEKPYEFIFNSDSLKNIWKNDMNLNDPKDITAEEAFLKLKDRFEIDPTLSDEDVRKILIVRSELYKKRYTKFLPIKLAYDVSRKTIGSIEENSSEYVSINVGVEGTREYNYKNIFSHILGYIRGINSEELDYYRNNGFKDYTLNDIVGKDGIEKSFETTLKGKNGIAYYEVDNLGRIINKNEELSVSPIAGNNVFLTLDANLQKVSFNALESSLKDTIINRLLGKNKNINYSSKDILSSMVSSNNINIKQIINSDSKTYQYKLKKYALSKLSDLKDEVSVKTVISKGIANKEISEVTVIMTMFEQNIITGDNNYKAKVKTSNISPLQVLIDKLNSGEITPQMTGLVAAPATGSVIVTDIATGGVLASVSYPSYDNNRFVNTFDNQYYIKLSQDPTEPLSNRPFTEPRAPGSTFKMITAIAALESGFITPKTEVYDKGTFTAAGRPYARCWIGSGKGSHGSVNVITALEVSCNYFFYDVSYKMGIEILNKYMEYFGLNNRTGVEVYELYDYSSMKKYPSRISSPAYKKYITKLRNPDTKESDLKWTAGNTIRTSIGQDFNNYTAANLVKYIATLANGKDRISLHFLNKIEDSKGNLIKQYEPILEESLKINNKNLQAVYDGMYQVTAGEKGTLRNIFKDFPVKVAAKSGTAQESSNKNNHTIFVGFAPYENPQIAITVIIPYGDDTFSPAPKVAKKIIEEYMGLNKEPEKKSINTLKK